MSIRFAIFTDLHFEHIHDGYERIESFIHNIKDTDIDFIIQLGDLCSPIVENKVLLEKLNSIGKPLYNVLGNHDTDSSSKETALSFLGMDNSYYSFIYYDVKFVVLDTCFIKTNDGYEQYHYKNYKNIDGIFPYVPDYELSWLENELNDDNKHYVIFSHHSLENNFAKRGTANRIEVRNIIDKVNSSGRKVLLCANGHDHGNSIEKIGETYYFGQNSMSYMWCGAQYEHFTYSDEVHQQYPFIKDIVLYEKALFSIITIADNGTIEIQGMDGGYQTVSPKELGMPDTWNGRAVSADVMSVKIE